MSTVVAPPTAKGQGTRRRLLECARDEAIRTGGELEVSAVAKAAGVVPSVIYRYFTSKAGLLSALIEDFFDRLHDEVLDVNLDAHGDWAAHERLRLGQGVRFHYADPFAVVLYGTLARGAEAAHTDERRIAAVIEQAAANIRRGQARGELPADVDAELAGAAMFGAMQRVMVQALSRTPPPPESYVVEVLWRQVAASVHIGPETRKPTP
ncbi:MAG: TetR/AcrR family transcriptional regulator [Solirubrobacteraceae bacterium]